MNTWHHYMHMPFLLTHKINLLHARISARLLESDHLISTDLQCLNLSFACAFPLPSFCTLSLFSFPFYYFLTLSNVHIIGLDLHSL